MSTPTSTAARSAFGQELFDGLAALPGSQRLTSEQLEVIYALAYAHVAQGQYAQALPVFAFLSQYGPTRKHYLAGLALCLQMEARYDEAIRIYSLIGVLFPTAAEATLRVAECQLAQAQLDAARASLELVLASAREDAAHAGLAPRAQALLSALTKEAHA
ncbi:SycD/LcrH family type III secretion system chaperone [Bordetella genomosp. 1]|uniref:SycD/LcrH family type III secretion system chaperone n=1 Tax=Bordetella genomosp. 1 TaxID=1395607 RepID=UPI0020CD46F5|nr:SycD/LcrH family type III secretion system chaperone [Bordetella genomosp. 1]MDQ8033441.1 SycD/LcrH family type III secretion system chaperone [Bordetella sp.]